MTLKMQSLDHPRLNHVEISIRKGFQRKRNKKSRRKRTGKPFKIRPQVFVNSRLRSFSVVPNFQPTVFRDMSMSLNSIYGHQCGSWQWKSFQDGNLRRFEHNWRDHTRPSQLICWPVGWQIQGPNFYRRLTVFIQLQSLFKGWLIVLATKRNQIWKLMGAP